MRSSWWMTRRHRQWRQVRRRHQLTACWPGAPALPLRKCG